MNGLKSLIWTIIGILVFVGIIKFAWFILPYVLVAALVTYIVFKIKNYFDRKNNNKYNSKTYNNSYNQQTKDYNKNGIDDEFSNGKVIDVDYKEVDK